MTLPSIGSTVKILQTGQNGLVVEHLSDEYAKVNVVFESGRVVSFLFLSTQIELTSEVGPKPPKYMPHQSVTVDINGKPWTGHISGMLPIGDKYFVSLLVEFDESEIQPFVVVNPGH